MKYFRYIVFFVFALFILGHVNTTSILAGSTLTRNLPKPPPVVKDPPPTSGPTTGR